MEKYALIVAGGSGKRMGSATPKQFMDINGKPVIFYSIKAFYDQDPDTRVIVVLPPTEITEWSLKISNLFPEKKLVYASGGSERFLSVYNGLREVCDDGLVAIHDAARPLVSSLLISRLFSEAALHCCAIPAINPPETVRLKTVIGNSLLGHNQQILSQKSEASETTPLDELSTIYPRDKVFLIQTPQVFKAALLKKAYRHLMDELLNLNKADSLEESVDTAKTIASRFTDDAAIWEYAGNQVHLVMGEPTNVKITLPHDLLFASYMLNRQPL